MGFSGFANPDWVLVAGALFIAAAMTLTGLDRRIALMTLSRVGTSSRHILGGTLVVIVLLSLVVPSATARAACVVPIMLGIITAFGIDKRSNRSEEHPTELQSIMRISYAVFFLKKKQY